MRATIDLNGTDWQFGSVPSRPFGPVGDDAGLVREWLPALVPGDVRLDLLNAGRIKDPYYGMKNEDSQWVDGLDWWYRREVELDWGEAERAWLVFEGVDYQSAVFWDGVQLGAHTGMFSRQVYELPQNEPSNRRHTLAVRVWGSGQLPKMKLTRRQRIRKWLMTPLLPFFSQLFPDRFATLKCQMQFGWDFAPRLRTCGIWDDVSIIKSQSVFIEDVYIVASPPGSGSQTATVQAKLTLDSDRAQSVRIQAAVHGSNFASEPQTLIFDLDVGRGRQNYTVRFDLQEARLWSPWDRGAPNLYGMDIAVLARPDAQTLDSWSGQFGVRSFELVPAPDADRNAEPWVFVINGERESIRGANWVPLDAMPGRLRREHYIERLVQVRAANINFLRVWGGGLKEKRAFYDLCDELGVLVWQEFPFAGAVLDRFPSDPEFLDLVQAEAGAIVRAVRNHPSLVVWCGGNEFNTRGNRHVVDALCRVVEHEDGTRPFKPASPYRDESHNWKVWHRSANIRDYREDTTPFLSEFGLQAAPQVESLRSFLPPEHLFPPNDWWTYHRAELQKVERYARGVAQPGEQPAPGMPFDSLEAFVDASQRAQAFGLQVAIEHMRRRKNRVAGVVIWQFDDPWPAISWSIVDYYGRPKRAYRELSQLYSPVLASFDYTPAPRRPGETIHGALWLINDLDRAYPEVELRAHLNDREIYAGTCSLAPNSATRVDSLDVTLGEGENILRLELHAGGQVLADHSYDLGLCDHGEIHPLYKILYPLYMRLMR